MNTKLYLGLDVHKNSIVVASALADGSEPQSYAKWGGSNLSVERGLLKMPKKFDVEKSEISIFYEAASKQGQVIYCSKIRLLDSCS